MYSLAARLFDFLFILFDSYSYFERSINHTFFDMDLMFPTLEVPPSLSDNLVDPASSHMLVSKIKPCMSKFRNCERLIKTFIVSMMVLF